MSPRLLSLILALALGLAAGASGARAADELPPRQADATFDYSKSFPKGSGARYALVTEGDTRSDLIISIAESSPRSLRVEYFMKARDSLVPIELWQQFRLDADPSSGAPRISEGYLLAKELKKPEKLPQDLLRGGLEGLGTEDFLLDLSRSDDQLKAQRGFQGVEEITVAASGQKAMRAWKFQLEREGQKVTYWISREARPLGLIKLISTGRKPAQNYRLELEALVQDVAPKIDPSQAVPLSKEGGALIGRP